MKTNKPVKIVVAETSAIIRTGVIAVLKRLPDVNFYPIEVTSMELLRETVLLHTPDIVIINPTFEGWFDINTFKERQEDKTVKYIALVTSVIDSTLLKNYDETISLYDDSTVLSEKILQIQNKSSLEEALTEKEPLSQREKEIIVCVVKGMTNKAIADQLFLSIHTVITHRRNIARKLQIHSTAGLTIYAIVNKLVELKDIEE